MIIIFPLIKWKMMISFYTSKREILNRMIIFRVDHRPLSSDLCLFVRRFLHNSNAKFREHRSWPRVCATRIMESITTVSSVVPPADSVDQRYLGQERPPPSGHFGREQGGGFLILQDILATFFRLRRCSPPPHRNPHFCTPKTRNFRACGALKQGGGQTLRYKLVFFSHKFLVF